MADIRLSTLRPGDDYLQSEMQISSAAYPAVETLYPIRLRYRTWYVPGWPGGLAFESQEIKPSGERKHRISFLDQPAVGVSRRDVQTGKDPELALLLGGGYEVELESAQSFDRLSLLQHVRRLPLQVGQQVHLPVHDGKRASTYRIQVEKRDSISAMGREWNALKVRFDGVEKDRHGNPEPSHRPVYLWFSDDPQHLPLLAESRHTLGRFRIELLASESTSPPSDSEAPSLAGY